MKLEYVVVVPNELAAGIRGFTDDITIEIANGSPDFETIKDATEHFRQAIREWYDMGQVLTKEQYDAITESDAQIPDISQLGRCRENG